MYFWHAYTYIYIVYIHKYLTDMYIDVYSLAVSVDLVSYINSLRQCLAVGGTAKILKLYDKFKFVGIESNSFIICRPRLPKILNYIVYMDASKYIFQ